MNEIEKYIEELEKALENDDKEKFIELLKEIANNTDSEKSLLQYPILIRYLEIAIHRYNSKEIEMYDMLSIFYFYHHKFDNIPSDKIYELASILPTKAHYARIMVAFPIHEDSYSCLNLYQMPFSNTVFKHQFPLKVEQQPIENETHIGTKGTSKQGECIGDCQQYVTAFEQQHPEYFKATVFQNAIDANPCILQNAIFKSSNPQDYLDAEGFITDDRLVALTLEEKLEEGVWEKTVEAFASRIHKTEFINTLQDDIEENNNTTANEPEYHYKKWRDKLKVYHQETNKNIYVVQDEISFFMHATDREKFAREVAQKAQIDLTKDILILDPVFRSRKFEIHSGEVKTHASTYLDMFCVAGPEADIPETLSLSIGKGAKFYPTLEAIYTNYVKKPYYRYKLAVQYNGVISPGHEIISEYVTGHSSIYEFKPLVDKRAYCFFYLQRLHDGAREVTATHVKAPVQYAGSNNVITVYENNPCPSCNCSNDLPTDAQAEWSGYDCMPSYNWLNHGMKESFIRNQIIGKKPTEETLKKQLENESNAAYKFVAWTINVKLKKGSATLPSDLENEIFISHKRPEQVAVFEVIDMASMPAGFFILSDVAVNGTGLYYALKYGDGWKTLEYSVGVGFAFAGAVISTIQAVKHADKFTQAVKNSRAFVDATYRGTKLILKDSKLTETIGKLPNKLKSVFSPSELLNMKRGSEVVAQLNELKVADNDKLLDALKKDKTDAKFMAMMDENPNRLNAWEKLNFDEVLRVDGEVLKDVTDYMKTSPSTLNHILDQTKLFKTFAKKTSIKKLRNSLKNYTFKKKIHHELEAIINGITYSNQQFKDKYGILLPDWFIEKMPEGKINMETRIKNLSAYDPSTDIVYTYLKKWSGLKQTDRAQQRIITHELGHLYHYKTGLISETRISDIVEKAFQDSKKALEGSLFNSLKKGEILDDDGYVQILKREKYGDMPDIEYYLNIVAITDILQGITNGNRGFGHTVEYFANNPINKYMELYAHAMETYFVGNPVMKNEVPELYTILVKLIKDTQILKDIHNTIEFEGELILLSLREKDEFVNIYKAWGSNKQKDFVTNFINSEDGLIHLTFLNNSKKLIHGDEIYDNIKWMNIWGKLYDSQIHKADFSNFIAIINANKTAPNTHSFEFLMESLTNAVNKQKWINDLVLRINKIKELRTKLNEKYTWSGNVWAEFHRDFGEDISTLTKFDQKPELIEIWKSIKYVGAKTRKDIKYLEILNKIRKNLDLKNHILKGDYRKVAGCHAFSCVDNVNVRFINNITPEANSLGVIKGEIEMRKEIFNPNNGGKSYNPPQYKWVKKNTGGELQTFFPATWNEDEILEQCASAFMNPKKTLATKPDGSTYSRMYIAESDSGIFIKWFIDADGNPVSFFPDFY